MLGGRPAWYSEGPTYAPCAPWLVRWELKEVLVVSLASSCIASKRLVPRLFLRTATERDGTVRPVAIFLNTNFRSIICLSSKTQPARHESFLLLQRTRVSDQSPRLV